MHETKKKLQSSQNGFADFENIVDRGLAEIFGPDSGLYLHVRKLWSWQC